MDKETLIRLFQSGMHYPEGNHVLLSWRAFELQVETPELVRIEEYEAFFTRENAHLKTLLKQKSLWPEKVFHVGGTLLDLAASGVVEHAGKGWF